MRLLLRTLAGCFGVAAYALIMTACFIHADKERYAIAGMVTAMVGAFIMLGAEGL